METGEKKSFGLSRVDCETRKENIFKKVKKHCCLEKLCQEIYLKGSTNAAVWKSFVNKSENTTKNKSDGKIKIEFEFNFIEQRK